MQFAEKKIVRTKLEIISCLLCHGEENIFVGMQRLSSFPVPLKMTSTFLSKSKILYKI